MLVIWRGYINHIDILVVNQGFIALIGTRNSKSISERLGLCLGPGSNGKQLGIRHASQSLRELPRNVSRSQDSPTNRTP